MDSELLYIHVRTPVAVKLIINSSPALEGLCDWQSSAEAGRVEENRRINRITVLVRERPQSQMEFEVETRT